MSRLVMLRSFAGHSSLTLIQQGTAAVTGIVIVRAMNKVDYAHFVLAFGMANAIGILAEAGVISTLLQVGASLRGSPAMIGLLRQAVTFRRRTTTIACGVVLPLSVALLYRSGADVTTIALLVALVAAGSFATAASQMSAAPNSPRLPVRPRWHGLDVIGHFEAHRDGSMHDPDVQNRCCFGHGGVCGLGLLRSDDLPAALLRRFSAENTGTISWQHSR